MTINSQQVLVTRPSLFNRLWRGAVDLSPLESALVHLFVEEMPPDFRLALESQIKSANVIQRDPRWIEVRFYTMVGGQVDRSKLPLLAVRSGEVKLLSITFHVGDDEPRHANFWAVDGCFVMINLDRSIEEVRMVSKPDLIDVRQSWRSNIEVR